MCCAIFFIRDILNYHILCKCKKKNKNDDFTSMIIVLVGHANAVTISSYIVCECTWYGDWRVAILVYCFDSRGGWILWHEVKQTKLFIPEIGTASWIHFCNDYAMPLFWCLLSGLWRKSCNKILISWYFISSETQTLEECWRTFWSRPKQRVEQRLASMNVPSFWIRTYNWLLEEFI